MSSTKLKNAVAFKKMTIVKSDLSYQYSTQFASFNSQISITSHECLVSSPRAITRMCPSVRPYPWRKRDTIDRPTRKRTS